MYKDLTGEHSISHQNYVTILRHVVSGTIHIHFWENESENGK